MRMGVAVIVVPERFPVLFESAPPLDKFRSLPRVSLFTQPPLFLLSRSFVPSVHGIFQIFRVISKREDIFKTELNGVDKHAWVEREGLQKKKNNVKIDRKIFNAKHS